MKPDDLRDMLSQFVAGWQRIGAAAVLERFALRNGSGFAGAALPPSCERGVSKQCFMNAARLSLYERFTYCEGFTCDERLPFPVHHAWCLDDAGRVIDNTLKHPERFAYWGVTFTKAELMAHMLKHQTYGLLDIGGANVDLIRARDPALFIELDELRLRPCNAR